jgi:hypothetical protein
MGIVFGELLGRVKAALVAFMHGYAGFLCRSLLISETDSLSVSGLGAAPTQ